MKTVSTQAFSVSMIVFPRHSSLPGLWLSVNGRRLQSFIDAFGFRVHSSNPVANALGKPSSTMEEIVNYSQETEPLT